MGKFINLVGKRFGKLVVQKLGETKTKDNKYRWQCLCDCGNQLTTSGSLLRTGQTRSCGCLQSYNGRKQLSLLNRFSHGKTNTVEYRAWSSMKARCYDVNHEAYHNYGGRGIAVCDRWLNSFEYFLEDMGERPSSEYSLNRIDVEKGYCLDNCEWATEAKQSRDKRKSKNKSSKYKGVSFSKKEGKFKGYCMVGGIYYHLGYSDSDEYLACKYDEKIIELTNSSSGGNVQLGLLDEKIFNTYLLNKQKRCDE